MLTERDEQILAHVGLYTISIRKVIEHVFFSGQDCDNVISRLVDAGHLQKNGGDPSQRARLPGGISYYQLTRAAASRLNIPEPRTRPRTTESLRRDIAVLWFCTMCHPTTRRRLERWELKELFGPNEHLGKGFGIPHAIELQEENSAILRLYTPSTAEQTFLRTLRVEAEQVQDHSIVGQWANRKTYRFMILVDSRQRQTKLTARLTKLELPVSWSVQTAPSLDTLQTECKRFAPGDRP